HALSATVSADAVSSKAAREIDMAASSQTWSGPRAVGSLVGRTKGLGGRVTAGNSPARAGDSSHAQLLARSHLTSPWINQFPDHLLPCVGATVLGARGCDNRFSRCAQRSLTIEIGRASC